MCVGNGPEIASKVQLRRLLYYRINVSHQHDRAAVQPVGHACFHLDQRRAFSAAQLASRRE
jgi:hypothetical protein